MILNPIDLLILKEFCKLNDNEYTTTWQIMKKIFKSNGSAEANRNNEKIKKRIEKMASYGFFKVEGLPKTYTLNSDNVFYKPVIFPSGKSKSISVMIGGKFVSFEL